MQYQQQAPTDDLLDWVESFWMVDSEGDTEIIIDKIVPDGYPEMIFHYGDAYEINITGHWERQALNLLAGQISQFFHLRNSGRIGMFAIKFKPWAPFALFGAEMDKLIDRVIPIPENWQEHLGPIRDIAISSLSFAEKQAGIENWLRAKMITLEDHKMSIARAATQAIISAKGNINLKSLPKMLNTSERSLQRQFKQQIGLSPKFYSRIIRLSHVFQSVTRSEEVDWAKIVYEAGFYDQSHFIKNFKEFTGEEPSSYGFDQKNMANLFLRK